MKGAILKNNEDDYIKKARLDNFTAEDGTVYSGTNNNQDVELVSLIQEAMENFNKSNTNKILIIAQTTFNLEKFEIIAQAIKKEINSNVELEIKNTICNATKIR